MDAVRKSDGYTVNDIYALPDGERAEVMDGTIYYMAPPGRFHQQISMFLTNKISRYIEEHQGGCEIYAAPFAVFLNKDDRNYLEPDISVICDTSKLDEKGCHGAPDWVIEIVSPSSRTRDYFKKLFKYRSAGVREYWVVDPAKKAVNVYQLEHETGGEYFFGEDVPVGIFEGFSIRI